MTPTAFTETGTPARPSRILTAACLVAYALLSLAFLVLQPDLPDDQGRWLAAIADAGWRSSAAMLSLTWSQLPLAVAAAGLAVWLRPRFPRLASTGAAFAVLGAFGHTAAGTLQLSQIVMAGNAEHRAAYSDLLAAQWASPLLLPFTTLGLLGTVVGILLLSIAHFRSQEPVRWAGPALWAWIVVEFVGSALSPWATYLPGLLLIIACGGLAAGLLASRRPVQSPVLAGA